MEDGGDSTFLNENPAPSGRGFPDPRYAGGLDGRGLFPSEDPGSGERGGNTTERVPVPSSLHVAEIVGHNGCKIKALRFKTNTFIKSPGLEEDPVFVVTGRPNNLARAKFEILYAARYLTRVYALRAGVAPQLDDYEQTTILVRVPSCMVGLVVGFKGATIKHIQKVTNTFIVTPLRGGEPVFWVTGMLENVDLAREEIGAHVALHTGGAELELGQDDFLSNGTDVGLNHHEWVVPRRPDAAFAMSFRRDCGGSLSIRSSTDSFYARGKDSDVSACSPFLMAAEGGGGAGVRGDCGGGNGASSFMFEPTALGPIVDDRYLIGFEPPRF